MLVLHTDLCGLAWRWHCSSPDPCLTDGESSSTGLPAEGHGVPSQGPGKGSADAPAFTSIEGYREDPPIVPLRPNLLDLVVFRLKVPALRIQTPSLGER